MESGAGTATPQARRPSLLDAPPAGVETAPAPPEGPGSDVGTPAEEDLAVIPPELLADLEAPRLVLSDGYVGPDRRRRGPLARLARATFTPRRSVLRLELLVATAIVGVVAATGAAIGLTSRQSASHRAAATASGRAAAGPGLLSALAAPLGRLGSLKPAASGAAAGTAPPVTSTTAPPAGAAGAAPAAPAPTAAATTPSATAAPAPPATAAADLTPQQLGAEALALIRYPWQRIPGYTIEFEPISDAPSPGFYGNTTFTWGRAGGTSVLYVYPGETVERLAGITAFEIGHEVDAAAVEPQGGEAQIENILGIHPASWAPNCDCAEQGYLSGWYAAAFSNYWSPGVGNWSTLAPEPTGATLAAVEPWLDPSIP